MLCILTSESSSIESSGGIEMLEIGDFRDKPESFFNFHTAELKSDIAGVRAFKASAPSPTAPAGKRGNERASTAL